MAFLFFRDIFNILYGRNNDLSIKEDKMKVIKSAQIEAEKVLTSAKALVYFNLSKASSDYDKKMMYLYKSLNNAEMARRML